MKDPQYLPDGDCGECQGEGRYIAALKAPFVYEIEICPVCLGTGWDPSPCGSSGTVPGLGEWTCTLLNGHPGPHNPQ